VKTLIFAFLVMTPTLYAQQKSAPSIEQCRADSSLWSPTVDNISEAFSKFDLPTLDAMSSEMVHCEDADPKGYEGYRRVTTAINVEIRKRLEDFIRRQGLTNKFFQEDAAGSR
jgi:hypothetical protein